MSQYISGRQPFLNVGIPGITTNTPVLDITGRVGIGTTNPSADLDLSTLRIRQSISDVNNFSGELGYFLSKDAVGLKWVGVSAVNNNALFVAQNSVFSGVSSYTGLNFISDANDLVAISTNINPNIVDVKINSYWIKSGNTGIYTSKFVGIGSTTPTVALDVIGGGKFTGVVTAGKFSGQSGIITGNVEVGSFIVTGISTFVGVTTFSKVGIGSTTIPRATLDVGGDVWVSGALTAISITADNFFGTISTSKYADSAGFTTSISLGSTTSTDDTSYLVLVGSSGTTIQQAFIDSQSLSYDGQTNTLNSDNIKVGFITATNAWIGVATINDLKVVNDTFRVGTAITMSNGIITATTFKGKFLDFDNLRVSGVSTFTNGTVFISTTTSTGTSNQPLQVVGSAYVSGNIGLGSTNPTSKLFVVGDGYFTGVITASEFKGNASTATYATNAGIATYTSEWILDAVGSSDYTFTGPGFTGAVNDPTLYLARGQQYKFTNSMGMHPFRIQSTVNGSVGTQYNDGVTNNDVSNGTLTWNVQFNAPNLLYYQCTAHAGMGGKIYIIDAGIGPDISINTTGIITANSFRGDGSQLTGLTAGVSISTNTTNQSQLIPYVTGTGSTTGFGVTTTGLVFNPSTGNLGIGSTVPTSKLTVQGNVLISGITTSGIIRISSSTASPNASVPVATLEAVGASSNYDIAIIPKGTGAIVANIPDGTATGGNKRGNYAVDLQIGRSSATQVASGTYSVIGGGNNNTVGGNNAVVCGGQSNSTGLYSYSAIVGGQSNINNGGGYSFIGGGNNNTSQTDYVVVGGGNVNTVSGQYSSVLGGSNNKVESTYSSVLGGYYNYAKKNYSSVIGGYGANTRNTYGAVAFAGANTSFGTGEGAGKQQARFAILSKETTDATPSTLTANGGSYDGDNVLDIPSTTAYLVKGSVIAFAVYSGTGDSRAWEFTTVIKRQYGSSTSLVGTPIINDIAYDSGASGWNLSITADASTNSLKVEVTGQASTSIRWVTKIDSTEVAF
jgi:hypothetical protein